MNIVFKKILKSKIFLIIILIVILIIIGLVVNLFINKESVTDTQMLIATLEKSSNLTTAKLNYKGYTKFNEGNGIPILTKGGFFMTYDATASAGINMKDVKVEVNDLTKVVNIKIPKAQIQNVNIIENTIDVVTKDFTVFDFQQQKDMAIAISKAEEDVKEKLGAMGIIEMADEQAESLIKSLLMPLLPQGYKFEFKKVG